MLPLADPNFPDSIESLIVALRTGFSRHGVSVKDIRAEGEWPRLSELTIDLSGAQLSRATQFPHPGAEGKTGITIDRLSIAATPLYFEMTPLRVEIRVLQAGFAFAHATVGDPVLQLVRAENGSIVIEAQRADLEMTLLKLATTALAKQGADVKAAELELTERSPRSLGIRAEVTAKAFLMTARVAVSGLLDVDDALNLRVRDLATSGDGMIANLASAFLRPRFLEIEKQVIPLAAFPIAGVKLHDVRIGGGNTLRLEAQLGS